MPRRDTLALIAGVPLLLLIAAPVVSMLVSLWQQGASVLSWEFLVDAPMRAGRGGGIGTLIVSTGWILAVCLAAAVPVGLGCALFLSEYVPRGSTLERRIGYVLDLLAATPSIVFGLFGYQFLAITLGFGFSILSGGLALSFMVLPLMIRASEQSLRAVAEHWRQAAQALGLTRWGWVRRVLLPQAGPGIAVGVILSVGRALAETAVLLFTAGYVMRQPDSVMDSGRALSVHIYDMAMNVPGGGPRAAATGLVLVAALVSINLAVRGFCRAPRQGAW